MNSLTLAPTVSYAALMEALEVIRKARSRVAELGFEASVVDVHAVPREVFDQLPGLEETGQFGEYDPYWSKTAGGVNLYCDEPPTLVFTGEEVPT